MPPRLSVVIVAFHRPSGLAHLLSDLDDPQIDIVVVNVEGDPDVSVLSARATEICTTGNVGYAAAVNIGIGSVATDIVVFTNDDVRVGIDTISTLSRVVASGEADVAVPAVVDEDGRRERTIAGLPTPWRLLVECALLPDRPLRALQVTATIEKWRMPTEPERIDAAAGIMVATRTDLLRQVPLPEDYFLYWEEMEWFWRLRSLGATVQFRPDATIVHRGGRSDVRAAKSRLLARNAVRCVRRTQGRLPAACALGIVVVWNVRLALTAALRLAATRPKGEAVKIFAARVAGLRAAFLAWREVA